MDNDKGGDAGGGGGHAAPDASAAVQGEMQLPPPPPSPPLPPPPPEEEQQQQQQQQQQGQGQDDDAGDGNGSGGDNNSNDSGGEEGEEGAAKRRRRKYAIWIAYNGAGYHGMQRNPGCLTIEDELERAFVKIGAIPEALAGSFGGVKWARAARTDKGVSAVSQVVSCKIYGEPAGTFAARANAVLPAQIRVLGAARVTEGFSARMLCDKRRYEYVLPVWMFDPAVGKGRSAADVAAGEQQRQQEQQQQQQQQQQGEGQAVNGAVAPAAAAAPAGAAAAATATAAPQQDAAGDRKRRRMRAEAAASAYVFDEAERARLNGLLAAYRGTHNFHNYTVKVDAYAPEAKRYILSFECRDVITLNGRPWARLSVVGQSFMLHQIRKMVGMAIAVMRRAAPDECLIAALDADRDFNVPMAPELGLLLVEAYFDAYNARYGDLHGNVGLGAYEDAAEKFKFEQIYSQMAARDDAECVNAMWVRALQHDPSYRFAAWPSAPKVRSVYGSRGGGSRGGGGKRAAAAREDNGNGGRVAVAPPTGAKRAALAAPDAARAAEAVIAAAKSQAAAVEMAEPDELDALY